MHYIEENAFSMVKDEEALNELQDFENSENLIRKESSKNKSSHMSSFIIGCPSI